MKRALDRPGQLVPLGFNAKRRLKIIGPRQVPARGKADPKGLLAKRE